jgi:hypothetical protein
MDAVDKVIIEYAAAFMMACREGHKESVTPRRYVMSAFGGRFNRSMQHSA